MKLPFVHIVPLTYHTLHTLTPTHFTSSHLHTTQFTPSHPHSPVGPYGTASAEFMTFPVKRGAFELVVRFTSDQLADILNDEDTEVV